MKPKVVKRDGMWGILFVDALGYGGSAWNYGSWEKAYCAACKHAVKIREREWYLQSCRSVSVQTTQRHAGVLAV